jgi:hypothetical protein
MFNDGCLEKHIERRVNMLSTTDQIYVLRTCWVCGGSKTVIDDAGNSSPCTACDEKGKQAVPVTLRDLAAFIGQEIVNQVRLQTGIRS